ncbi:hypothetical protein RVR_5797 [Actinacidiphila reveromycinica]|uniref:Uncharacterized protein n=1 Tax=Actinacidiphila reveromycinica TaxID=659352 RepID=A0A7U3UV96_9ACTN|nr:hypothetical protein [Streptomyces sp. SN-593]BBA99256.1 hypothetical protein RVR_5797 [Streptomyces sp. SN-593]
MTTCLIPDCNGSWHDENICDTVLADTATPAGAALIAELEASPTMPTTLVVWEGSDGRDLMRTSDQAEARAFADRLRAFAHAVDKGAGLLASPPSGPAKPEPVDYASRFAALDSDVLFDVEDADGTDAPHAYVESLLIVLADWRRHLVGLLAEAPAWSIPEVTAYERALSRTREAYMQWSFRWQNGPVLPHSFDLPQPVAGDTVSSANVARIVSAGRRTLAVRGVAA